MNRDGLKRVLVVEDDIAFQYALKKLVEMIGFQVETASTVGEAIAVLHCCERVLLDMNLPDGVGTAVLEHIREHRLPIKVAVVSGTAQPELLTRAQQLGADAIIPKPPDPDALARWLNS